MTRNVMIEGMTFLKDAGWLSVVVLLCIVVLVATQMVRTSHWITAD